MGKIVYSMLLAGLVTGAVLCLPGVSNAQYYAYDYCGPTTYYSAPYYSSAYYSPSYYSSYYYPTPAYSYYAPRTYTSFYPTSTSYYAYYPTAYAPYYTSSYYYYPAYYYGPGAVRYYYRY